MGSYIIDENILKEDEYRPPQRGLSPVINSELREFELPRMLEGELPFPLRNNEFEEKFDKIEKEQIIIDPLAFYVPYHFFPDLWGIYFRAHRIYQDFSNFINLIRKRIHFSQQIYYLCFVAYIKMIYLHELCHHIIEDIATVLELYSTIHYPFLTKREEEGLCEYEAFSHQTHTPYPFSVPRPLQRVYGSSKITFHPFDPRLRYINEGIVNELYYYWNRQNDPLYRPKVYPSVGQKIGILWRSFWNSHNVGFKVINVPGRLGVEEVNRRIFSTVH